MEPAAFFFGVCIGVIAMRGVVYLALRDRQRVLDQRDALQAQVDALVENAQPIPRCIKGDF